MRTLKEPIIRSVEYEYAGTHNDFLNFLIAIVRDYLSANRLIDTAPAKKEDEYDSENNPGE